MFRNDWLEETVLCPRVSNKKEGGKMGVIGIGSAGRMIPMETGLS